MKKIIIIGFILSGFLLQPSLSQDQELVDSLEALLQQHSLDTSSIQILQKLYFEYELNDSAKAMGYAQQILSIARQAHYIKGEAEALHKIGVVYNLYGNSDESLEILKKALELSEAIGDKKTMEKVYKSMGVTYQEIGDLPEAINYFNSAVKIAEEIGDPKRLAMIYSNLAMVYGIQGNFADALQIETKRLNICIELADSLNIAGATSDMGLFYRNMGNYPEALTYFLAAINILEKGGDKRFLCATYYNIGGLYSQMENYKESMHYLELALKIAIEINYKKLHASALSNIAGLYLKENNFQDALSYHLAGLKLHQEIGNKSGTAVSYHNLGILYYKQKNYFEALMNYNHALVLSEEIGANIYLPTIYNNIGTVYLDQKKFADAMKMANKALAISKETGGLNETKGAYELLSQIDSAQGNYKSALENYKLFINARDSLMNEENIKKITAQQMQYDFDKKEALAKVEQEKKDAILHEEIHHHKIIGNLYLIIGLSVLALAILLFHIFRLKARKKRIIADQKIRQLEEEKKLLAARYLVEGEEKERKRIAQELHDGLGVLLSVTKMQFSEIKSSSPKTSPMIEKATKFLEQASRDVRRISHNMMPGLLTKMGLFEALEDLFEQISDSDKIKAVCEILGNKERLPENKEIMLYRIVQEMVNNTMKYAEATKIELQMESLSDQVRFRYSDNGKGFRPDDARVKGSLGLQSIKSRVRFLDGKISLESEPGKGTLYDVAIPL